MDWKNYKCKRVVRGSLAGETQAYVETFDMLVFTKVFYFLFLDPWKSLSDVESISEKQHKSPRDHRCQEFVHCSGKKCIINTESG